MTGPVTRTPALSRATAWLHTQIDTRREHGEWRLPTIVQMAHLCGVAPGTMARAVHRAVADGVLISSHRGGTGLRGLAPAGTASPQAPSLGCKWKRVRDTLERDIAQGTYPAGSVVPSGKELQQRFGASYRTVAKAVAGLVDTGVLEPSGRSYRVRSIAVSGGRSTIILFTSRGDGPDRAVPGTRSNELLGLIQSACRRSGLRLRTIEYGFAAPRRQGPMGVPPDHYRRLVERESVIGFMVWNAVLRPATSRGILEQVSHYNLPVAVLDETAAFTDSPPPRLPCPLRVFPLGCTAQAGRLMARHLLGLGHRSIAYVCANHATSWSHQRLQGLRTEVEWATGGEGTVVPVVSGDTRALFPKEIYALNDILAEAATDIVRRGNEQMRSLLADALNRHHPALRGLVQYVRRSRTRDQLVARAVALEGITAWVGADDATAFGLVRRLRARGRRVPEDVSVCGFDDGVAATLNGLTSYNFDLPAVVAGLVRYLLSPGEPRTRSTHTVIDGYVVERDTSGPCSV